MTSGKRRLLQVMFGLALVFSVLYLTGSGFCQREIFRYADFCDYNCFMRPCMQSADPYRPTRINAHDACYPPIAYVLTKAVTARRIFDSPHAAEIQMLVTIALAQLAGLLLLLRAYPGRKWLPLVVLALSPAMLASLFRDNPSGWSFAFVCAFLAGYRSAHAKVRAVAAFALGCAVSLKVTPILFGVLYLPARPLRIREWPWRELSVLAVSAAVLTIGPFGLFGGYDRIGDWLANALANSAHYSRHEPIWGLVSLLNRLWPGETSSVCQVAAAAGTRFLALLCVLCAAFSAKTGRRLLFVGAAMMFLTHHDYGAAYLIPAFVHWLLNDETTDTLSRRVIHDVTGFCWLVLFTPLQIPGVEKGWSVNEGLQNEALLLLILLAFVVSRRSIDCATKEVV